ncbi:MAG: response regulator [Acidobacteria bacterium]|nr:response regulator [Acidobacteriota bacterium]
MRKVLVVDDEPVIVNLLREFLTRKDYEVVTASNGIEALEKVKQEDPSVVLLDINMPGKNGLDVLKEIKAYNQNIGIIMVTALSDQAIGSDALRRGAFDYITKPFDLDYLEKVLWWKLQLIE